MSKPLYTLALFQQKKSPYWWVRVYVGKPISKRFRFSLARVDKENATDRAWAERWLASFKKTAVDQYIAAKLTEEGATNPGGYYRGPDMDISQLVEWYLDVRVRSLEFKLPTVQKYNNVLRRFAQYCTTHGIRMLYSVNTMTIVEFSTWWPEQFGVPWGRTSAFTLRKFIRDCAELNNIDMPEVKFTLPREPKGTRYKALTADKIGQFRHLLDTHFDQDDRDTIDWALATGWTPQDIFDLRWDEVDLQKGVIDRERLKTENRMLYPISPIMREILDKQPLGVARAKVFASHPSQRAMAQQLYKATAAPPAGSNRPRLFHRRVRFRDLRRTFASVMVAKGIQPSHLRELMAHKSLEVTLGYYVDISIDDLRKSLKSAP